MYSYMRKYNSHFPLLILILEWSKKIAKDKWMWVEMFVDDDDDYFFSVVDGAY